jgi:predicted aspartyl protease
MPIRDYPFITVNPQSDDPRELVYIGGPNARPYLWLRIANPATDQAIIVPAIVDTGANGIAIPAKDAETLGHDLTATPPKEINTASGVTEAYPHTVTAEVLGILPTGYSNDEAVLYPLKKTIADFTVGLKSYLVGQGALLLGLVLSINYRDKRFSIRIPEPSD